MKKTLLLMMLFPSLIFAQDALKSKAKKNEITINAFELVIGGVLPISYERFINDNQSITFKTFFFDNHYNDFNSSNSKLVSLQAQYNFYFSEKKQNAGFFFAPFMKFTGGTYQSSAYGYYYDANGNYVGFSTLKGSKVNALVAGFGLGYKFLLKKKLSFGISTDIGRVLNERGYYKNYGPVEARVGVSTGIRF